MSAKSYGENAIRILSFDNGGPGTYSQLLIVKEYMARIAQDLDIEECDVYPADYFDLMGGVGFGGLAALLLGHLKMNVDQAIDILLSVSTTISSTASEDQATLEENTRKLRNTVNETINGCGVALDVKTNDKRLSSSKCKVVIYAATVANLNHPIAFRTYSRRGSNLNLTIVDAICSTLAFPSIFAPVIIGNGPRQQKYVGGVHGANNPTRELLKEAGNLFGNDKSVAQILSIGTGRPRVSHLDQAAPVGINRVLEELASDCEGVARELSTRLLGVEAYLRLNVDRGMENSGTHGWDNLGPIETHTSAYLDDGTIQEAVEASLRHLHERVGFVTLREINYTNSRVIRQTPVSPDDLESTIVVASDIITPIKVLCEWLQKLHKKYATRVNDDLSPFLKMLKFHLATAENQIAKLEEDFEYGLSAPSLNTSVTEPMKAYFSLITKLLNAEGKLEEITQTISDMDSKFQEYTIALHRSVEGLTYQVPSQGLREILSEVGQAYINPNANAYGNQHVPCLRGTREKTLQTIRDWANDGNTNNRMFCLLDIAGSGKSTVAKTMVDEWKREGRLLARFFFSRDTTTTMSIQSFCSTVANAFSALNPRFKASMGEYMSVPDWQFHSFEEQFEGLVASPLRKAQQPAILIIDALDECSDRHGDRRRLLEILCTPQDLSPLLRILVTGRPEPDIKHWAMERAKIGYTNFVQLEKNSNDVEFYIKSRLQEVLPDVQDRLYPVIRDADGLFIWARIACDLLLNSIDPNSLLETLGNEVSLDYLYTIALNQSIPGDKASQATMITVLQMVLAAREPLSIVQLDKLAPKQGIVEPVVGRLSSLLLHRDRDDPIRLLHATLREFLTTQTKAGQYHLQPRLGHYTLALGCISIISHQSQQDISKVVKLDHVSARIFDYSSNSWVYHCTMSCRKLGLNGRVIEFASTGLDNWLDLRVDTGLKDILLLCRQRMSPKITELLVEHGLEKEPKFYEHPWKRENRYEKGRPKIYRYDPSTDSHNPYYEQWWWFHDLNELKRQFEEIKSTLP